MQPNLPTANTKKDYKNGIWEGHYQQAGKRHTLTLNLTFQFARSSTEGLVSGKGNDPNNGEFTVDGTAKNVPPFSSTLTLSYVRGGEKMVLKGWRESDRGGIFGEFQAPTGTGNFSISPSKEGEEALKKAATEQRKSIKKTLKDMGYEESALEKLPESINSVEDALEWILNRPSTVPGSGNATDTSGKTVDNQKLSELISMGFDQELASEALRQTGGDLEAAANLLFEQN